MITDKIAIELLETLKAWTPENAFVGEELSGGPACVGCGLDDVNDYHNDPNCKCLWVRSMAIIAKTEQAIREAPPHQEGNVAMDLANALLAVAHISRRAGDRVLDPQTGQPVFECWCPSRYHEDRFLEGRPHSAQCQQAQAALQKAPVRLGE